MCTVHHSYQDNKFYFPLNFNMILSQILLLLRALVFLLLIIMCNSLFLPYKLHTCLHAHMGIILKRCDLIILSHTFHLDIRVCQ